MRRGVVTYRRFTTAAEAIRHAIEDVSSAALGSCALEVDGQRIQGREDPDALHQLRVSAAASLALQALQTCSSIAERLTK